MNKKYRLTNETIIHCGRELHRIESLCNFNGIEIGQKGGFIENEINLSHNGNCWVYDNAKVFDNACVYGDACIFDGVQVRDNAQVYGHAFILDDVKICDNASIFEDARVEDNSVIGGSVQIYGLAHVLRAPYISGYVKIYDHAWIDGRVCIKNDVRVYDYASILDDACISDTARIYEKALVKGNASISGDSRIYGNSEVTGYARIHNAEVGNNSDYIVFKNWWSSGRYFTWTRCNNMWRVGCFYGTGRQLITKAYRDSEISGREYERIVKYVESINKSVKRLNLIQRIVCKVFRINYE